MTFLSEAAASLSPSGRKGRYGVAYLRSVCAQAGVGLNETSPDEDVSAVDCDVKFPEGGVAVQVKCTATRTLGGATAAVALEESWKTKWAQQLGPVYLVLVIVPRVFEDWLGHDETGTTLHGTAAYWVRVNGSEGVSVSVPKTQRLTGETLAIWRDDLLAAYGGTL